MRRQIHWLAAGLCGASMATGQATFDAFDVKTIAEVQVKVGEGGQDERLVPADRVVPGDQIVYTLEIRNTGAADARAPSIVRPVPAHMAYVADSAAGPGAQISYSIDGGRTFDRPDRLTALGADGRPHVVSASNYTHIRWQLKYTLKSKSVAFARFRAVVK